MDKFTHHQGIAAPLLRNNIDTDAIIPSREMKTVSKLGLSSGLFAQWRYLCEKNRQLNPNFILNQQGYENASILLSGDNFGCGSSREHAVWALKEYGIKCIIAESFGAIFYRNCIANGLLAIVLEASDISRIVNSGETELSIDLANRCVGCGELRFDFTINEGDRHALLEGIDPIAATLQLSKQIKDFALKDKLKRPWLY